MLSDTERAAVGRTVKRTRENEACWQGESGRKEGRSCCHSIKNEPFSHSRGCRYTMKTLEPSQCHAKSRQVSSHAIHFRVGFVSSSLSITAVSAFGKYEHFSQRILLLESPLKHFDESWDSASPQDLDTKVRHLLGILD
jgi:hypothetical protein